MRKLFTLCLLVFSLSASAQWQQTGSKVRYVNGLGIPTRDTAAGVAADSSQILIRPADSALYVKYKRTWLRVGGGGGSIAGSGTANYIPKFTSSSAIGNSQIFDNGTNVGIGTTSPNALLHLNSSTSAFLRLQTTNGAGKIWGIGADNAYSNGLNFSEIGVADGRLFIASGGNVGIGTTSPDARLRVAGASANSTQAIFGNVDGRGLLIGTSLISGTNDAGSVLNARGAASGTMIFQTDGTERMRITSSGNTLIGTTTDNGTDRLQVSGSVRTSSNLQVDGLVGINITPASYSLNINSGGTNVTRIATQQTNNINDYEHSSSTPFGRIGNASGFNASGATGDMSVGSYNNLSFYTRSGSFIERARITATSGNVLISKTTDNGIDKLQVNGSIDAKGFAQAYTTKTGAYTATTSDYLIDCLSGTFTVTLPDALLNVGRILVIKNSGTGTITVDGNGSQTIDGATTYSLSAQWATVQIMCDGGNWKIISKF